MFELRIADVFIRQHAEYVCTAGRIDEAQFSILETAGRIAAQFERETQGIQINIEQLTAKLHDS